MLAAINKTTANGSKTAMIMNINHFAIPFISVLNSSATNLNVTISFCSDPSILRLITSSSNFDILFFEDSTLSFVDFICMLISSICEFI